ncbi:MAG: CHC2 zinc finger domain-containing protein, partial [Candidatus Eisenbacteria bacterium]|nr:CHC2 zinc finger domain-containing protein [Candidatus Eisenbacteria bacterium]
VTKSGAATVCSCPFHDDRNPSCSVDLAKGVWFCHVCKIGGSVIDLVVRRNGCSVKDAMRSLATDAGLFDEAEDAKERLVASYDYRDQLGRSVMHVDRYETGTKKRFAQWHEDANGQRVNSIAGVQRVLYRLETWAGLEEVHLCEGEKCVHALEGIGFPATCNPGGSSNWVDAYAAYLRDKHVIVWPDNDEPGAKWLASVMSSLEGKVASLRIVRVPKVYGDIADLVDAQGGEDGTVMAVSLIGAAPRVSRGVCIPLLSAEECRELYRRRIQASDTQAVDLARWLPSMRSCARPLLPGDLMVFLSDTGVGKTTALANIAYSQRPLPTIFFELELSPEAITERFIAQDLEMPTLDVERQVKAGHVHDVSKWSHVFVCPESRVTLESMEEIIQRAELKMQGRPRLVLVDYVGLMSGGGHAKRYERLSTIAEGLKVLARTTETVVILASQVRRDPDRTEIDLHDAKDSGSVENSAQLVLGAWRPDVGRMTIKVLKQTKRAGQVTIECLFDGDRQRIREVTDAYL